MIGRTIEKTIGYPNTMKNGAMVSQNLDLNIEQNFRAVPNSKLMSVMKVPIAAKR